MENERGKLPPVFDHHFSRLFMETPKDATPPAEAARQLLKQLRENYPVFANHSPLAIGIDKQILARQPETDRKLLRLALGMHTHSLRYFKTFEKATHRFDLDGQQLVEISEEHRRHATETLRERFRKEAARKKAAREAEAEAQRRTVKLNQLVEKFGKGR